MINGQFILVKKPLISMVERDIIAAHAA